MLVGPGNIQQLHIDAAEPRTTQNDFNHYETETELPDSKEITLRQKLGFYRIEYSRGVETSMFKFEATLTWNNQSMLF